MKKENDAEIITKENSKQTLINIPKKSVVRVCFSARNMTLSYYNDQFDLKKGDLVYVDGKLEGLQGRVVDVTYSFKIKLSEYKKVIAVVDTNVNGQLFLAGSHLLAFDPQVLSFEKVKTWFNAPANDEEYVIGESDECFPLDDLSKMNISHEIADRGNDYYLENKVAYLSIDNGNGKAIVCGNENYIVEFTFNDGEISNLVCSCFCSCTCKHEFAVMLQLKECLEIINTEYNDKHTRYFAAVSKNVFINTVLSNKQTGQLSVNI